MIGKHNANNYMNLGQRRFGRHDILVLFLGGTNAVFYREV